MILLKWGKDGQPQERPKTFKASSVGCAGLSCCFIIGCMGCACTHDEEAGWLLAVCLLPTARPGFPTPALSFGTARQHHVMCALVCAQSQDRLDKYLDRHNYAGLELADGTFPAAPEPVDELDDLMPGAKYWPVPKASTLDERVANLEGYRRNSSSRDEKEMGEALAHEAEVEHSSPTGTARQVTRPVAGCLHATWAGIARARGPYACRPWLLLFSECPTARMRLYACASTPAPLRLPTLTPA